MRFINEQEWNQSEIKTVFQVENRVLDATHWDTRLKEDSDFKAQGNLS